MNANTSDSTSPAVETTGDDGGDDNTSAVQDQESSKSCGKEETEPQIFKSNLPPNFPSRFTKLIKDPESIRPRILMEKRLHKSNVAENRNRLPIPATRMKEAFLLAEEEEELKSGEVKAVLVIEPGGETVSSLKLRLRRRRPSYVLHGAWKDVVARNSHALKRGKVLRVWYFRVDGGLWFALEVVEKGKRKDREIAKRNLDKWYRQNVFSF